LQLGMVFIPEQIIFFEDVKKKSVFTKDLVKMRFINKTYFKHVWTVYRVTGFG